MKKIRFEKNKKVTERQLKELFLSVNWFSGNYSSILEKAINHSSVFISAWDGDSLIGLARGMGDGGWQAVIDCLLVHPQYQRRGIGSQLLELLKEEFKDYLYVSAVPDEKENVSFYAKHGFAEIKSGTLLQISNIKKGNGI